MAQDPDAGDGPSHAPGDRLESWKDIAAYLRRDVRTVQRWEQTDGLPVHRHKRAQRPIPYAYKSELDAWWTGHGNGEAPAHDSESSMARSSPSRRYTLAAIAALLVVVATIGAVALRRGRGGSAPADRRSIAVLPFVDLTEGMKEEEFADGITEELIDRLNKMPGLRVPAPTSSFYFKNKHVPVAEIAQSLHVAYLLDGSVRKSGARVRIAARLIRVDNANVVWSDTYERAWDDVLAVQDDIAGRVATALRTSIDRD